MQVEIEIVDEDAARIARALGADENDPGEELAVATRFAQLAINELVDWILGRDRHRTLTELQIARVSSVFESILTEEAPTTQRLYNSLNLPYGQAAYIARVLADRDLSHWRQEARIELVAALHDEEEAARDLDQGGDGATTRAITISSLAWRELQADFAAVAAGEPTLDPPRLTNSVADLRYIDIAATTIVALMDAEQGGEDD